MISVIVPIYNESKILTDNSGFFRNLSQKTELIFIDGSSTDNSAAIAETLGKLVSAEKGRALQMNTGAGKAGGDILFFLHADNAIGLDSLLSIEREINQNSIIGGCLTQRIKRKEAIYRIIETHGNCRARISKVFYGDQGIFVKKDMFVKAGGFPEVPIMEDVLFTKKLKRCGRTKVLPDKIEVSARRWEKNGILKTILIYNLLMILFRIRVPLKKIKFFYGDLR